LWTWKDPGSILYSNLILVIIKYLKKKIPKGFYLKAFDFVSSAWTNNVLGSNLAANSALASFQGNGPEAWDFQVHDGCIYRRRLTQGTWWLGNPTWVAEACDRRDEFIFRVLGAEL
jgi:hypothetical protein